MAEYTSQAINAYDALDSKGNIYAGGKYGWKGWHAQSPIMITSGSVKFERKAEDDELVYITGTVGTYIPSKAVSDGGFYSYPILIKIFVGSSEKLSGTLNKNLNHVETNPPSFKIDTKVSLSNNTDDITIHYYCCAGSGGNEVPACTSQHKHTDEIVFKLPAGTLKYLPYTKPAIKISSESTKISRYDGSATIKWNESKGSHSTTYLDINGKRVNQNSGDNAGSFTFSPKTYGVGQGSSYNVTVYRNGPYGGGTTVSDSQTLYTYTEPTLSNLTREIPIINANQSEKFAWNTNVPNWKGKTLETHTLKLTINGNNVTELNDLNNKTDIKELTIPNVGKYVKFDSSKINGQEVDVKLTKVHTQDSNVPSASLSTKITVRRIPIKTVEESSIIYKLVDTSGKVTSTVLPEDAIIDRKKNGGVNVSFTYPSNASKEHYGIVHGYKLVIYGYKGAKIFEQDYDTTNLTTNMTIDVNSLMWSSANKLRIYAYYKHSSTDYNPEVDNKKYLGPYIEKTFPTVITRLDTPEINYPAEGSSWINNNFRVLFQLPNDGDFDLYPDEIADNYIYRDIQLKITSGNQSVTYSWTSNPLIFSIDKATYKAKVSINPSLMSNFPIGNSYSLKIRVRKNYGYPDANKYAEDSWSDWSLERKFTVKTHSLFVNEGDYIMATDYEKMYNMIVAMRNTYPTYNLKCHLVKKGDYILASDFDLVYQDIWSCFNTVNNWGKYGTTKSKVKFNEGQSLLSFSSTVGEYVTDLEDDTSPNGRNYMIKMISDANLLK